MEADLLALRVAFLFLPGIVALLIVDALIVHRKWEQFDQVMYAFALGVASYLLVEMTTRGTLSFWSTLQDAESGAVVAREVAAATLAAILLGGLVALAFNRKWLSAVAGGLGISQKYGDENLFYYALNSDSIYWVEVRLTEQNLVYQGSVETISSDEESREILLRDVRVFNSKKGEFLYDLESVYLSLPHDSVIIEMKQRNE